MIAGGWPTLPSIHKCGPTRAKGASSGQRRPQSNCEVSSAVSSIFNPGSTQGRVEFDRFGADADLVRRTHRLAAGCGLGSTTSRQACGDVDKILASRSTSARCGSTPTNSLDVFANRHVIPGLRGPLIDQVLVAQPSMRKN